MRSFCFRSFWVFILAVVFAFSGGYSAPAQAEDGVLIAKAKKRKPRKKKSRKKKRRRRGRTRKMTIQPEKEKKKPRVVEEEEIPAGPAKIKLPMVEEKKAAGATLEEKLLDEEIKQLRDIIRTTSEGPTKADLLFRLAERYYEKARAIYYTEMQEYDNRVNKWQKELEKNPDATEPKIDNRKSQVYTKQAMDVYRIILGRYKNYHRRDEVLFTMGYNLYESGNKSEGVKMYWDLIKGHPESRFVSDAYLAMGEHFFNSNDVFNAKKAYEKALQFKTSKVYTFALYKLAWCDYNLGDYDNSIKKFKEVIEQATLEAARGGGADKNKIQLKREGLQDLVLAFSQVDALDVAEEYYLSQVGKQRTNEYMRKLAHTYEKQGKAEMTVKSFRRLLNEYPGDPDCPSFHNSIVLAYRKMNLRDKVRQEVNRLIDQYKPGTRWAEVNKNNKMAIKKANSLVEGSLRDLVTSYHKEAQETKRWDTYNLARVIYAKYMETFPNSEYAYKLRWYYSDILYKMGDFYGAAQQYAKVVEKDSKGTFSQEAAYNAVLSWDKCIALRDKQSIDCRKWQPKKGKGKLGKEETRAIKEEKMVFIAKGQLKKEEMEKKEVPFFEKKFLGSADMFAKVAPKHDMYLPIRFKSAFFFYKYHHYKEMARRFGEIIERYPKNKFALRAVRLSLNTMYVKATNKDEKQEVRTSHWKEINRWAKTFQKNMVLMSSNAAKREKFGPEIQSLVEESGYNVVLALREKNPLEAAKGFETFVNDYPKSRYAHRALYAAIVIFNEASQLDLAIIAGQRLLKQYSTSDRYNQTIEYLADFHTRVADFARAANYNEMFFDRYLKQEGKKSKKDKKKKTRARRKARAKKKTGAETQKILITDKEARDALYNAALLRESMGQFDLAVANYVKYIKNFPDTKDVPDIFYKIGEIYERRGQWRKADRVYQAYPEKYADRSTPGRMLAVNYKHAMALRQLDKKKESDKLLDGIIEDYNKLPEEVRNVESRTAVSHARFLQLEEEFNDYINIKLVLPPRTLRRNLLTKIDIRPKLEKKYEEVVGFKDPDWSIASLVRIGQLSQNLSQSMYDAPVPAGLTPDQQDIYVQELQNQALPLEEKAMVFYRKAIEVSGSKGIYNGWTIKAEEQLKIYQPSSYPEAFNAELVSTEYIYQPGCKIEKMKVSPLPEPTQAPVVGPEGAASQPES
ncbi:MAG TPA: tetratricopeptide repeat protein [Myxococcota bacterium]|nr:tetratricopeptide repeat protein [Myxococcota bacterium]